jgi:hypothetical protein
MDFLVSSSGLVVAASLTRAYDATARLVELCEQQRPSERADVLVGDATCPIDDEGFRQPPDSVLDGDAAIRVAAVRKGDAELLEEGASPRALRPACSRREKAHPAPAAVAT